MKRAKFFLERGLSIFAQFEQDEGFASGLNLFFPAIDRFDSRQNICAGREFLCDELRRNPLGGFPIWKRTEREKNSVRHSSGWDQSFKLPHRLGAANPTATDHDVVIVNHCRLARRDRPLRFV
jgi:hypothetical protein